jgi:RimJ/RimL family protein N-acetyltransferase
MTDPGNGESRMFDRYRQKLREAIATSLGGTVDAFTSERLTIVDRPEPPAWPYVAMVATFGTGTLVSIDPEYRDVAEEHAPSPHYRAHYPSFLNRILEAGATRGIRMEASPPMLLWALSRMPEARPAPPGLTFQRVDAAWMVAEQANHRFENGVGEPGVAAREMRNRFGAALMDDSGRPIAVAGAFLTFGVLEIGVDVVREHRGRGLAPLVVAAVTREIVERGETPLYGCGATNIRSQHTALAAGFMPVCSDAFVVAAGSTEE